MWVPFAEEAVATIYSLADHPDRLATVLLLRLCQEVAPSTGEGETDAERHLEPTLRDFDGDFDPEVMSTQGTYATVLILLWSIVPPVVCIK